jgi:hypothetical protein
VRRDVADGGGGTEAAGRLGEGGARVSRDIEGRARGAVEDGVVALVAGDDRARGQAAYGGESALILGAEDAAAGGGPKDSVGVG